MLFEIMRTCGVLLTTAVPALRTSVTTPLRATLVATGFYSLLEPAPTLEALTRLVITASPRIVIIDKACGMPAVIEWVTRMRDRVQSAVVVWGNSLCDADALRVLRAGARGGPGPG